MSNDPKLDALLNAELTPAGDGPDYLIEGNHYDRVTGILHKVLPPYLVPWAEKLAWEAAHKVMVQNQGVAPSLEQMIDEIKTRELTAEAQRDAGASRGIETHLALETWIKQGIPPTLSDFDPEHRPYAQSLCQWLIETEPEFECSEVTMWHPEYKYAGTCDAIGHTTKHPKGVRFPDITGQRFAFDLKTNTARRAYYPQHYFQLAAYRHGFDYHGVELDGEAIVAIGPSPWKNNGRPYTMAVNFVPASLWPALIEAYRAIETAQQLNPRSRKRESDTGAPQTGA